MSIHQQPAQFAPMPVVAQILAGFERDQLAAFIEVALSLIDASEIDTDLEDDDPDSEADAVHNDQAFVEWDTRGRHKLDGHGSEVMARAPYGSILHEDDEDDDPAGGDLSDFEPTGHTETIDQTSYSPPSHEDAEDDDPAGSAHEGHEGAAWAEKIDQTTLREWGPEDDEPRHLALLAFDHPAPVNDVQVWL